MRAIVVGQPRDRERKSEREREKTVLKTTTIMVKKKTRKDLSPFSYRPRYLISSRSGARRLLEPKN